MKTVFGIVALTTALVLLVSLTEADLDKAIKTQKNISITINIERDFKDYSETRFEGVIPPYAEDLQDYVTVEPDYNLIVKPAKGYTSDDLDFLAQNLYFEERSTLASDIEIAQIGYVVLNRVASKHYKDSIQGVVWFSAWSSRYNRRVAHFSWTLDGKSDLMHNIKAKKRSFRIAKAVLEGTIPNMVDDADHYLNKEISSASWWKTMKFRGRFNNHWFYKR